MVSGLIARGIDRISGDEVTLVYVVVTLACPLAGSWAMATLQQAANAIVAETHPGAAERNASITTGSPSLAHPDNPFGYRRQLTFINLALSPPAAKLR